MANSPKGIVDYTNKLNETFARQGAVAPVFDATATYAVGKSVMYNGKRYTFNTAHSAGAWDPTEVDEDSVQDELNSINNHLANKADNTMISSKAVETIGTAAIESHGLNTLFLADNGYMYKAISAIAAGATMTEGTNCEKAYIADEIRALAIKGATIGTIGAGKSASFSLSTTPAFSGIIYTDHNSTSGLGYAAIVRPNSFIKELTATSSISATMSDGVLTLTNGAGAGTASIHAIILGGGTITPVVTP